MCISIGFLCFGSLISKQQEVKSSGSIVTGLQAEQLRFDSWKSKDHSLRHFSVAKQPWCKAKHSPPPNADVKNVCGYTSTSLMSVQQGA
jgi:hypothetical protein